uniref:Uncharacterized protein n=1 Tax=Globisporangium ultimum (strain ATCC 200006 / CBS 805.95 / DAOM BR144) TaxID=431595 RepID=K3WEN9_GLOUD
MLLSGPSDWSEVDVASVGGKANLLQHAYHPQLRMAAMPLGGSVVITRYATAGEEELLALDQARVIFEEVAEQPVDHLRLHSVEDTSKVTKPQMLGDDIGNETSQIAIACQLGFASSERFSIRCVVQSRRHICAKLAARLPVQNARGVVWNAKVDILL